MHNSKRSSPPGRTLSWTRCCATVISMSFLRGSSTLTSVPQISNGLERLLASGEKIYWTGHPDTSLRLAPHDVVWIPMGIV
jgi:hypothetical protein